MECTYSKFLIFYMLAWNNQVLKGEPISCNSDDNLRPLQNITFDDLDGVKIWGKCNYPNPRIEWIRCGRDGKSWLCDPDKILNTSQADTIKTHLVKSFNETHCRCEGQCSGSYTGHPMAVALIAEIRVPDLTGFVCSGSECADVFPQLDPRTRQPTEKEYELGTNQVLRHLLDSWQLGRCNDDVIILYVHQLKKFSVIAGNLTEDRLGEQLLAAVDSATSRAREGEDVHTVLRELIQEYSEALERNFSWQLVLGIVLAAVLIVLLIVGIVSTVLFCVYERRQGKTWSQVYYGLRGGEYAAWLSGKRHTMVPTVYDQDPRPTPV